MSVPHLFLDFDGVLHPSSLSDETLFCRMDRLGEAVEGRACLVVISSSWRHHYSLQELLTWFPSELRQRVVGATGAPATGRWPRYQEILAYLRRHDARAPWRALDDSWNEFPPHCEELIVCDPNTGLQVKQVVALRAWLHAPVSSVTD